MPIKLLEKFVSKDKSKSISGVLVTDTHFVATDGFKLIEIERNGEPLPIKCTATEASDFPDYKFALAEKLEAQPVLTVQLTPAHLRAIADFFDKNTLGETVSVELRDELSPLVFKSNHITAYLMPVRR